MVKRPGETLEELAAYYQTLDTYVTNDFVFEPVWYFFTIRYKVDHSFTICREPRTHYRWNIVNNE